MENNFEYLLEKEEYKSFAEQAMEAEKSIAISPATCAILSRRALELAVRFVFSYDADLTLPYRDNVSSLIHEPTKGCKVMFTSTPGPNDDVGCINSYSYLRHEFEQAKKKKRNIIILYNSTRNEFSWLPFYMDGYEANAYPFWTTDSNGRRVGNYNVVKQALGV